MPFRGVISRDNGAPWGTTGLTSATWLLIDTELVRIGDLYATQPGVYFHALINPGLPVGGDPYPHVILFDGVSYCEDGHSRIVRAALRGEWLIEARVFQMGDAPPQ